MNKKLKVIKKLNNLDEKYDGSWMGGDAATAFIVAVGAGPWKVDKQYDIQKKAIDWFYIQNVTDLRYIKFEKINIYPLDCQNRILTKMLNSLEKEKDLFEALCLQWKVSPDWGSSLEDLFKRCGCSKKGSNVLWMFARDYLNIPSFPIDREVKKALEKNNLPVCSWEMTKLCLEAEVSPNILSRKIFLGSNHNWGDYRPRFYS